MKSNELYMGVDPGVGGGIALIDSDLQIVKLRNMPETLTDMIEFFFSIAVDYEVKACIMEKVWAMPMDAIKASFALGKNIGRLEACLTAIHVPWEEITPQSWMKYFSLYKGAAKGKTQWKNELRDLATRMFGVTKKEVNLQVADALLIARYCYDKTNNRERGKVL